MSHNRRIKISPFRQKVQMDRSFVEQTWEKLRDAIVQIQNLNESKLSYEELYRSCYNLVLNKEDKRLYQGVIDVITAHMAVLAQKVERGIGDSFLPNLTSVWKDHLTAMQMILDILMYLDNKLQQERLESVNELGLTRFLQIVIRQEKINSFLRTLMLDMVQRERQGDSIERVQLKEACNMLVTLGVDSHKVYESEFEIFFLAESATFYQVESQQFLQEHNAAIYLKRVEDRLNEEQQRVEHCLDASTEERIIRVVEEQLIEAHLDEVMHMEGSGIVHMLENDRIDDLQRMFSIVGRIKQGHETMRVSFRKHLESRGRALVQDEDKGGSKNAVKFVQNLIGLKAKYDKLVNEAFHGSKLFAQAVNAAFVSFINLNDKSPEYISLFIDDRLKKGVKEMVESELDCVIDRTIVLFRFLKDKDIFERYYKQHLAKRLLLNKTSSDETEMSVISKLKVECGYSFTQKLEGMFSDMRTSKEMMAGFKDDHLHGNPDAQAQMCGIELQVRMLTTGYWPTSPKTACKLPLEMQSACSEFSEFYHKRHTGRKIFWQFNWGSADVSCQFAKRHVLIVSTFQAVLLCLFNSLGDDETVTFKEIQEQTDIYDHELKRALLTLACGKQRVLTKSPRTKAVAPDHRFGINVKFSSKMTRVKVQQIAAKETPAEREVTKSRVDEYRRHLTEACIVRIMKSRKTMHHSQLVSEVTEELKSRFVPSPAGLKKRIENLIERDYLERAASDRRSYNYLA